MFIALVSYHGSDTLTCLHDTREYVRNVSITNTCEKTFPYGTFHMIWKSSVSRIWLIIRAGKAVV